MGRRLLTAIFLCGIMLWGCEQNGMQLGDNWVDVHTRTIIIDTCTLELSTCLLDSIPTSGGGRIFSGSQRSEQWGRSAVSTYMTFNITSDYTHSDNPNYQESVRLDSLTLYIVPDSMYCGDTLKMATLGLYRLTEEVELNEYGELYGHSAFTYDPTPLAVTSFYPKPVEGREMYMRLPDRLGQEFLDKLFGQDDDMENDVNFRRYFKGMALIPDPSCEAILAFQGADSVCMMKLYYHTVGASITEHVLNFKLTTTKMFTRVESDRSETPLEGISFVNNEIPSAQTDNKAFAEGLTGIYTKIELPHLNNIRGLGDYGTVVSASLVIYPLAGTYNIQNNQPLPDNLYLYVSNEQGVTIGGITSGSGSSEYQNGSLNYDSQFPEKTYYSYDVTDFIKSQLGMIGANKRNLQLIDPKYGYTLSRLVIGDQREVKKNIELHITYAIFNED